MSVGTNIRKMRKERGLTQAELAEKAGISRSYFADIEKDYYNPSLESLQKIASALGTTSGVLLGDASLLELVAKDNGMSAATAMFERQRKDAKPMDAAEADKWDKIFKAPKQESQAAPSDEETRLVGMYREMNQEGQEKLLDYADDMVRSGKYIKTGSLGVVDKEA